MRSRKQGRALFIGNSFTARNDVPGLTAALAATCGRSFAHRLLWAGGASLRMHWNKGEAQRAIGEGGYDFVVLQEQSTLPIKNAGRMHENIRLFDAEIRAAGAKTVLYQTWARRNAPESQAAITRAYAEIGAELDALVVPVGQAWERALQREGAPTLHDKDQSHPTLAGSYLAACVFYAVLFDDRPTGEPQGLSAAEAGFLQQLAREIVEKRP